MKKIIKKVMGVVIIYLVVAGLTLLLTNRVESLESREDFRNQNASVILNLK